MCRRVWEALAAIPPELRATLVLYDLEGLTYEEIATIERAPLGKVKSRLSRGRDHLRQARGAREAPHRLSDGDHTRGEVGNSAAADLVRPKRTEPA